jgi:hypothetical protein
MGEREEWEDKNILNILIFLVDTPYISIRGRGNPNPDPKKEGSNEKNCPVVGFTGGNCCTILRRSS